MNSCIVEVVAKAQLDDRLHTAERERLVALAGARRSAAAAPSHSHRIGVRSLRVLFA